MRECDRKERECVEASTHLLLRACRRAKIVYNNNIHTTQPIWTSGGALAPARASIVVVIMVAAVE